MSNALQAVLDRERQLLEGSQKIVYKQLEDGGELNAWVFLPEDEPAPESAGRSAVIILYSSAWDRGRPTQFAPHAMYFAGRGAVAVLIDYRTASNHGGTPLDAIKDARSAVRWMRLYAEQLEVDPEKIILVGGSAGAHAAAATSMLPDLPSDDTDPLEVSCSPNALVLYSPIIEAVKDGYGWDKFESARDAKHFSLYRGIAKGQVPMKIFQGTHDRLLPFDLVYRFAKKMRRKKNLCEFYAFEGRDHGFFNLNVDPVGYEAAISETDRFLSELGFLEPLSEDEEESRLTSWREQEF